MTAPDRPATSEWLGLTSEGVVTTEPAPPHEGPRYRLGGDLGVGAMGRVRAAYDVLLDREIAVKQVRSEGDAAAGASLLREARVTAGLDHPGIIAVLDADDGGRTNTEPFYAMRVVRGQSLAESVAAGTMTRTALLRALLQVAHAVAHAHARGVVHRDLSPHNIRLGAHGEVVVMDWGLAASVAEAARGGVVCGTPAYRAPELASGESSGPASDVWSVGALILLAITGAPPTGVVPRRGIAVELRALLSRALSPAPRDRYADAGELARDLAAFLDGAPVSAHRDRPWHRAARFARRHPAALVAGALGLTAVAIVAGVLGTLASRRADEASRSRHEARAALHDMIVERAHEAVRADRRGDAEQLALRARELGGTADVAGIEAVFARSPRVELREWRNEDGCTTLDLRSDGARLCVQDGVLWLIAGAGRSAVPLDGEEPLGARFVDDGGVIAASLGHGGNHALRFDRDLARLGRHRTTGGRATFDARAGWGFVALSDQYVALAPDGSARVVHPCPSGVPIRTLAAHPASTATTPATVVRCADGTLVTEGPAGTNRVLASELVAWLPGGSATAVIGGRLVHGGDDGRIGLVELPAGNVIHAAASPVGAVKRIVAGPDGDAIVAGAEGVGLWRPDTGEWRHIVNAAIATDATVLDGHVVSFGAGKLVRWQPAGGGAVHRVSTLGGLATVAWSPDGRSVAFGGGDGVIHLVDAHAGGVRRVRITDQVVKSLAFDARGTTLAIGLATDDGMRLLDVATLDERTGAWREPGLRVRRLAYLDGDVLVAFPYTPQPRAHAIGRDESVAIARMPGVVVDTSATEPPAAIFAVDTTGALWRYDGDGQAELPGMPGARAVAVSGDGRIVAIIAADGITVELRTRTGGNLGSLPAAGATITDAALDRDGRRLAIARLDGMVEIWRVADRSRTLAVRAHAGRVAALAFSPDGCTLATASWDATGRLLDTCR